MKLFSLGKRKIFRFSKPGWWGHVGTGIDVFPTGIDAGVIMNPSLTETGTNKNRNGIDTSMIKIPKWNIDIDVEV